MNLIKYFEAFFGIPFELLSLIFTSILIPILAFLFVNFYTRLREKLQILSKLKNNKSYIIFWIERTLASLYIKIHSLEEFRVAFLNINKYEFIPFNGVNLHTDKLKQITPLETFSTLVKNLRGDEATIRNKYYDFLNSVDFVDSKVSEIGSRAIDHGKKTSSHFQLMRDCYKFINDERVKYLQSDFTNVKNDRFLFSFYLLHEKAHTNSSIGMIEIKENYIEPLKELCIKSLQENPSDTRIPIIQKQTQEYIDLHDFFENEKNRLSEYIISSVILLEKTKMNIDDFVQYHSTSKFKRLFKLN